MAAAAGHAKVVDWLLLRRANASTGAVPPNLVLGYTPLHCAAGNGHVACCRLLLQHRADISACDAEGHTPLHSALRLPVHVAGSQDPEATPDVLRLLVASRGDQQAKNKAGCAPLDLAAANPSLRTLLVATEEIDCDPR